MSRWQHGDVDWRTWWAELETPAVLLLPTVWYDEDTGMEYIQTCSRMFCVIILMMVLTLSHCSSMHTLLSVNHHWQLLSKVVLVHSQRSQTTSWLNIEISMPAYRRWRNCVFYNSACDTSVPTGVQHPVAPAPAIAAPPAVSYLCPFTRKCLLIVRWWGIDMGALSGLVQWW